MIELIKKRWLTLGITFSVFAFLGYFLSLFFITPKYSSTVVVFPPNTHANIHLVEAGMRFGSDKEIGETLEVINSSFVKNQIKKAFKLGEHYGLDSTSEFYQRDLGKKYDKHISVSRTVNKSVHIEVLDQDPNIAANIANRIVEVVDAHKNEMIKSNIKLALDAAEKSYLEKQESVDLMTDSLDALREAGESTWTYGEERKSGKYQHYERQYTNELNRLHFLKNKYEELYDLYVEPIPKLYVVSKAEPSSKPVSPKKSLNGILAGLIGIAFMVGYWLLNPEK